MTRTAKTKSKVTMGTVVKRLIAIKDQKSDLALQEKTLNEEKAQLEHDLKLMMQAQGTKEIAVDGKRVTYKEKPIPKIVNGALLWEFLKPMNRYDIYYARLKQAEYEELLKLNKGEPLPGTEIVEVTEFSYRSVSTAT